MFDYSVCEGASARHLATIVQGAIAEGWEPIGGIAVYLPFSSTYPRFYQAVVREDRTSLFGQKLQAARRKGWTLDEAIANTLDEKLEEANAEED